MPTSLAKLYGLVKGSLAIYCISTCSIVLVIFYVVFVAPFMILSKSFERRLQEVVQRGWVYLLLGVTENVANSQLLMTLPEECGPEMEALVYHKLKTGFEFGFDEEQRLSKLPVPQSERGDMKRDIVISNHQIYMDWIYIWAIMARLRREGNVKIILKRSLLNIPIFGLGMRLLNFIFLHRNWEVDKLKFGRRLQRLVFGQMPFSLVIFPEGTTLCDNTIAKSVKFAKDNDLPVPSHTLLPRVTGMQFALTTLGQNIGGVFDLTIGYTGTTPLEHPEDTFGLKSLFFNGIAPPLIHVHVKYHPISTIPYNDQSAFQDWLYTVYREKDRLMAEFYQNGCFRGIKSRRISVAPNSAMLLIAISTAVATVMLWSLVAAILFWREGQQLKREKRKRGDASSSSEDENPEELLGKIVKQTLTKSTNKELCQIVPSPSPRVNALFIANPLKFGEFILFGGECSDGNKCEFFGESFTFNVDTGIWTQLNLSISPSPRSAHQAVILPTIKGTTTMMVMFGGEFGTSKETKFLHFSDTWLFDFTTCSWRALNLKVHPPSRSGHRMSICGDYVVLFGGFFDAGTQARYLDDLWLFDIKTLSWIKVDWMSEYEGRPAARSGFSFVPHPEGVLLYGGYTQFKSQKGLMQGQVLNDLWLLRMDPGDMHGIRWKKLKLTPNAPLPRSGSTSLSWNNLMINFGGVIDEEVSDEFLLGTCVSDIYRCELDGHRWSKLDLLSVTEGFDMSKFCGRFNAMMTLYGDNLLIFGGIFEVGDRQFTLDDMYRVDLKTGKLNQIKALSPELDNCWTLQPATISEDESDGESGEESEFSSSDCEEEEEEATVDEGGRPIAASYSALKDFFGENLEYWMNVARQESASEESNEKQLRAMAFLAAKRIWEEQQELDLNISLDQ